MSDEREEEMTDWPWNSEKEKLTEPVLEEIAKNLSRYALDAVSNHSRGSSKRDRLNVFHIYCDVVKVEYIEATIKKLKGSMRSEARKLAEQLFDLIAQFLEWVNTRGRYADYNEPVSYTKISTQWDAVVGKWNLLISEEKEITPSESNVAPDAQADANVVIIDSNKYSKSQSFSLLNNLINDAHREGVPCANKRELKTLKELLTKHGDKDVCAHLMWKNGKATLSIPAGRIIIQPKEQKN